MGKAFIGPKLRQIRLARNQTQAEMAEALGLSASYINLLENNQRSLSVRVLMSISSVYGIDWRELTANEAAHRLADLRQAVQDPIFGDTVPDLQELRAAVDHAPILVEKFLQLYRGHHDALRGLMQVSDRGGTVDLLLASPEAVIYDFFRDHGNHFPLLEA
jgi:transcriptional regulator with XRE-family HTH domain